MSDFVSFAVSVCPFCCLEWLGFWIWRLFWRWVQHRMVVLCTDLLVSDRNSYIINMCLTIISLTDAFLGLFLWAFPEACFLFLIITNIWYSGILLPLFKSAYSEPFYLSEHIRFRMHYHLWAESFQDCICLLFFISIGNKMMIR